MDAQYRREHGCQQHLQWHRNPAHKQAHCHAASDRAAIEMPYHRLSKGIANPSTHASLLVFTSTQLRVQFTVHGSRIGQALSEPFTRHSQNIDAGGTGKFPSLFSFNVENKSLLSLVRSQAVNKKASKAA